MNLRVLVTGGAGFIGSHIVDQLRAKGYNVVALDDLSAGRRDNLLFDVPLKVKSVADIDKGDVEGFDDIIHCAAQVSTFWSVDYPEEDFRRNALSTFHLFETCRKYNDNALIIYTSSRSVHGDIPEPSLANESFPFNPSTFYNVHKIYGELLCKIYSHLYGMKFIILRPSNVYGPRQPYWMKGWYNFISFWIKLALENEPIPIYGSGEQVRDYTYVEDTTRAYVLALENLRAIGEVFLLPTGRGVSLNELANMIIRLTDSKSQKKYLPPRKGDIMRFVGSYKKAKDILNWEPLISLEEGLKKEIEWMRQELAQKR
ncbi:MAG: NAD-dependent epimerase/dehydratase family protein [archaeon]|nr:NAD-dependent epimerase/dehydratase family protein [archaeon]MCP8314403.1 NAD-dependent epimerase/dehydratase family protein [archaeon]MCP8317290.1 NAD-dependent epimerase/dehydratase family protein [archaeon]MCP8319814.1 NAD-dependent epimerase/dehydratase family protein [archaeon]